MLHACQMYCAPMRVPCMSHAWHVSCMNSRGFSSCMHVWFSVLHAWTWMHACWCQNCAVVVFLGASCVDNKMCGIPFSLRFAAFRGSVTLLAFLCGRQHVVLATIDVCGTAKDGCTENVHFLSFGCRCVTYPFTIRTLFLSDPANENKTKIRTETSWYTFLCTKWGFRLYDKPSGPPKKIKGKIRVFNSNCTVSCSCICTTFCGILKGVHKQLPSWYSSSRSFQIESVAIRSLDMYQKKRAWRGEQTHANWTGCNSNNKHEWKLNPKCTKHAICKVASCMFFLGVHLALFRWSCWLLRKKCYSIYNSLVVQCVMQSAHEQDGSGGRWKLESFSKRSKWIPKNLMQQICVDCNRLWFWCWCCFLGGAVCVAYPDLFHCCSCPMGNQKSTLNQHPNKSFHTYIWSLLCNKQFPPLSTAGQVSSCFI